MISNCTSPTQETSQHVDVQRMAYWGDFVQTHVGLYQASGSIVVSLFNMIVDIFYIIKYYQLKKKKKVDSNLFKGFYNHKNLIKDFNYAETAAPVFRKWFRPGQKILRHFRLWIYYL